MRALHWGSCSGAQQWQQREYARLLQECAAGSKLAEGRQLHASIASSECHRCDRMLLNLLVQMYGKCGRMVEANAVFDGIEAPNVFSWTILMTGYAQNGHYGTALSCFRRMIGNGVPPSEATIVCVLGIFSKLGPNFLTEGKSFHSLIVLQQSSLSIVVETALVGMYSGLCSLQDAASVFSKMNSKGVVSWNVVIAAYAQNGHPLEALQKFREMLLDGSCAPDHVTFVTVLECCSMLNSLQLGSSIHELITLSFEEPHVFVLTALVNMYGDCGSISRAEETFRGMLDRDVVAWTSMMFAYAQIGQMHKALDLYEEMKAWRIQPSEITMITAMWACTGLGDVSRAKQLHSDVILSKFDGVSSASIANSLVEMLGTCGYLQEAVCVFQRMTSRDGSSWNTMISALVKSSDSRRAFNMFHRMQLEGFKLDETTCVNLLTACNRAETLAFGREIHHFATSTRLFSSTAVGNAVVNMYSKCGCLEDASEVFQSMPSRNVVSWNTMIAANAQAGAGKEAFRDFRKMDLEGVKPNEVTFISILVACWKTCEISYGKAIHERVVSSGWQTPAVENAVVNMYAKCGDLQAARQVFDASSARNVIVWTVLIAGYAQQGLHSEALELFAALKQQDGIEPSIVTYVTVLGICSATGCLNEGRDVHECIAKCPKLESNAFVGNALVNMYGRCGSLENAVKCFEKLETRDFFSWNALLAAYAQQGHRKEVFGLVSQMNLEGFVPNEVTFMSVLFACSHVGFISMACEQFVSMQREYFIQPLVEHYGCMVDILARAGWIKDAEDLLTVMPFHPTGVSWMTCHRQQ